MPRGVEERRDQREYFAWSSCHANVRGSGKYCELRVMQESEHLHHVWQRHEVSVAEYQQRRGPQRSQLLSPPWKLVHHGRSFRLEVVEARRIGSDRVVSVPHFLEVSSGGQAVLAKRSTLSSGRAVRIRRGEDQLADATRRAHRNRTRHESADAEPEQVGFAYSKVVEQCEDVVGQSADRHRATGIRCAPVALELQGYHLSARREGLEQRAEAELDGQEATMEQYKWPTAPMDLVVELQAVYGCVRHRSHDDMRPANSSETPHGLAAS